jgi:hypothetical protein
MEESEGLAWLSEQLRGCVEPVLSLPWILDIDVTVKPLYGVDPFFKPVGA